MDQGNRDAIRGGTRTLPGVAIQSRRAKCQTEVRPRRCPVGGTIKIIKMPGGVGHAKALLRGRHNQANQSPDEGGAESPPVGGISKPMKMSDGECRSAALWANEQQADRRPDGGEVLEHCLVGEQDYHRHSTRLLSAAHEARTESSSSRVRQVSKLFDDKHRDPEIHRPYSKRAL